MLTNLDLSLQETLSKQITARVVSRLSMLIGGLHKFSNQSCLEGLRVVLANRPEKWTCSRSKQFLKSNEDVMYSACNQLETCTQLKCEHGLAGVYVICCSLRLADWNASLIHVITKETPYDFLICMRTRMYPLYTMYESILWSKYLFIYVCI